MPTYHIRLLSMKTVCPQQDDIVSEYFLFKLCVD